MEGGSDPARPRESERPVPRVRVVIRPEAQVRPEKVEQGSGAEKSQVEKNAAGEPRREGTSVREFLIAMRARRSTGESFWVRWREGVRSERRRRRSESGCGE
ncbi:hypothetical protein ACFX13_024992 [Malus domestica]